MASKNFVVKHGITVGGIEVIDEFGQVTTQALASAGISSSPTKTSDLVNDSGFITSSSLTWNNIANRPTTTSALTNDSGFITGSSLTWDNISNKPTIPTTTSALANDSGFVTSSALFSYASTSYVNTVVGNINSALDDINGTVI